MAVFKMDIPIGGPLNLDATLLCGQAFRWRKKDPEGACGDYPSFQGVIGDFALTLQREEGDEPLLSVTLENPPPDTREFERNVRQYLALDDDLDAISKELTRGDPVMQRAFQYGWGLRILRQEPWECLASYILSSNNNIKNISRTVRYLCRRLGKPLGFGEYSFPTPDEILSQGLKVLNESKCGFRGRYLLDAAEKVAAGKIDLEALGSVPLDEAKKALLSINGVGPKICDCVLLFAYHRMEVFPVDVWIKRAMSYFYFGGKNISFKEAREEGQRRFGALSGYAQEYLYYYVREHAIQWSAPGSC